MSRQSRIDCHVVMITLIQLHNGKEQVRQREIQNVQFEEKKSTRKCNVGAKSYVQGDEQMKEKPDAKWE